MNVSAINKHSRAFFFGQSANPMPQWKSAPFSPPFTNVTR